jgi:hypothetical protein
MTVAAGPVLRLLIPAALATLLQPAQGFGPALPDVPASFLLIRAQSMATAKAFEKAFENGL